MKQYIVRRDDACPTMNHVNWHRMEELLDSYGVRPIVGLISENQDPEFACPVDEKFWERAKQWQAKGWTIAQHGLHHLYMHPRPRGRYYQLSHSENTEWAGRSAAEQAAMICKGYAILQSHGLAPQCFFAPAHTYDAGTVAACRAKGVGWFISDGYALKPYKKDGMIFLPSICDGPINMPLPGVYTFVAHPSEMTEAAFLRWKRFLSQESVHFTDARTVMEKARLSGTQGIIGHCLEYGIYVLRGVRTWNNHFRKIIK